jgi:hypothetical protein
MITARQCLVWSCALWLLSACSNPEKIDEDVPRPAMLTFYQLGNSGSRLDIFWHEFPNSADTRLRLDAPLHDCEGLAVYVNPTAEQNNRLSRTTATSVAPVRLKLAESVMTPWSHLPDEPCAVLVIAGYLIDEAFMGLSFSTREGVFHRQEVQLIWEGRAHAWKVYPLTGITGQLEAGIPDEWWDRSVTVSFDFPNGRREETTLSLIEAARLLDGPLYQDTQYHKDYLWQSVRFWIRAALAKLDLDFREREYRGKGVSLPDELVSVDGVEGKWIVDPRDGREPNTHIDFLIEDARFIRLFLE